MAINYTVGDNWGSGFIGNIVVPGGTSGLHGWTLEFDATFDISNIWGAEIVSHVGNHYVIRNVAWTADVPAGGQASFGFEAKPGSGGTTAAGFTPNGTADTRVRAHPQITASRPNVATNSLNACAPPARA